ncbi:MAG: sugar phosphate isomerase/epimerase family protein [Pseudomonadota bacterium]
MPGAPAPSRHSFAARVEACANAGYKGMCLHLRDYRWQRNAGFSDEDLREALEQNGMRDISLEFLVDWFLEGADGEQARADEATACQAARAYGARSLNVGSDFRGRAIPPAVLRARFHELCERAGENGLSIALEIVPWSDIRDVAAALALVDGVSNAGLVIDSWHVFRGGISLGDIEQIPAEKILCVQINDAAEALSGDLVQDTLRRRPCGEGSFDLRSFLASIDRTGSTAPLSVEIISPEFAALALSTAAARSFDSARALLRSM